MRKNLLLACVTSFALLTSLATAYQPQEKKDAAASAPAQAKAPEAVIVEKGKFNIDVTCKGTFEAEETAELSFHLDNWSSMIVAKAVAHGTHVKQGEVL